MPAKSYTGTVISDSMKNTVVVSVETVKVHARYGKRYKRNKNYPSHIEGIEAQKGDVVVIKETKPYSKTKKWIVTEVITKGK